MDRVPFAGASFGADIVDVDVSSVGDAGFSELYAAWLDRAVLRIRGQRLDDDALMRFARLFGPLEYRPMGWITSEEREKVPNPYLATISNIVVDGNPIGGLGAAEAAWHTDMSYIEHPPTASILYAVEVPEEGGATHFCNMIGALRSLPPDLERRARGARLKHDAAHDSVGTLRRRLAVYHRQTAPIIPYYEKSGVFARVDGMADIATVGRAIDALIEAG